jgi:hypothetical protein
MTTMNVLDAVGATVAIEKPLAPGRATASAARPVVPSSDPAYSCFFALSTAATASDIITIQGSATKIVRIKKIRLQASHSANVGVQVSLIKRSAANTGGTSTNATLVPHDSLDAAATAVVKSYTVNPSALGAAVGNVDGALLDANTITTPTIYSNPVEWRYGENGSRDIVLRGIAEFLAVNLGGATITSAFAMIEWTEE